MLFLFIKHVSYYKRKEKQVLIHLTISTQRKTIYLFETCISDYPINCLQASALIKDICGNLSIAAKSAENIDYTVVLRGDSTLRGHFPEARMKALECRIIILSTPS
jgi:hypothetical protein